LKSSDEGKKEERKYSIVLGGVGKTLAKRKGEFGEQERVDLSFSTSMRVNERR